MATETPHQDRALAPARGLGSPRVKLAIGIVVLGVALGYFSISAFQSAMVYYFTVGEVMAQGPSEEVVRVAGVLAPDSFERNPGETLAMFSIGDGGTDLPVQYDGVISNLFFNPNSQIVAEGTYQSNGVFHATNLIIKCPSKYQAAEPPQQS